MSTHQIVVIGSSYAGNVVVANLLKDITPAISSKQFKVIQIAPTDEQYWKIGAPRVLINPTSLPLEKALVSVLPTYQKYGEKYQFIKALVKSIDPATKTLQTSTGESVQYDSLVICSGTIFANNLWSTARGVEPLRAELAELHRKLPGAQTVVIGGGGPAGVETAGELGDVYPGGQKDITLYSGGPGLLNSLQNKNVGKDAEGRLIKQGIKVEHGIQVTSHRKEGEKEVLQLSNGETKTVDVYIEAVGDKPATDFVPKEWLDEKQKVRTDPQTLRLSVPGVTGVYCYGTAGSYSNGSIADVMMAKKAILQTLRDDLEGKDSTTPRTTNVYKKITSDMQFVPVGPTQGVGIAFGWKLPSFVVKMAKSKDFMIGNMSKYIEGTA